MTSVHAKWDLAIDLSTHQGTIDIPWMVKQQPRLKCVMAKTMEMWAEGVPFEQAVDDQWKNNVDGAAAAGIPMVGYMYFNPNILILHKRPFETDVQVQTMIRALQNKTYHAIALDIEKSPYFTATGSTPAVLVEAIRTMVNFLKHARKQGLIRDVPIGLYSNFYTIKDNLDGFLFDDVASGFFDFVWEARWMGLDNSRAIPWPQVFDDANLPADTFHANGLNGIRYWTPTVNYESNGQSMARKLVFWQYRGGGGNMPAFKVIMKPGGQPQAADMNLITVPTEELYHWLKFVPVVVPPVEPPPVEPPPVDPPVDPEDPPIPGDLASVTDRLDTIIDILRDVYNR